MDYNKMINIKRETNVNDNAFAMPPNKKITDTDDGGGSFYGNDIGVEIEDDYSYMIENENEDTVKSVKLSKELLSYFLNEIKNIAVSLLEPYHTHTFTVSVTDDFKESINRMGVIEPLLIAQSANYGKYEVISGHRRLEAAKAVGLEKLPCRIAREDTPREILDEIMVITNLQRRNTFTKMELAHCLAEEANVELHHNENTKEKRHEEYSDAFFIDNGLKRIVWIYYNPDSNAGGQYVTNIISFDKLAKISSISRNADDYFNTQISSLCTQYLSDVGTDAYKAAERMFYDNPDFVNATHTTMQALTKIALIDEWENELHNDLPSFIKSAFAWDELIGYGSIDDEIQYEETPVKVVRDFFLKEKGTMYSYEGEYTDCIWNLEERDGKPVINIAVKRENESKPVFSFDKTFEWNDITNAVIARIQQEKIYNKLVEHCYKFSKYHTDDYRVYDPEEGRTVIRGSAKQIKECFGKLLNKQEVKMLIETEIVPTLAKADEQFEVDCENDDMEI